MEKKEKEGTVNMIVEIVSDDFDFDSISEDDEVVYITQTYWNHIQNYAKEKNISIHDAFSDFLREIIEKHEKENDTATK